MATLDAILAQPISFVRESSCSSPLSNPPNCLNALFGVDTCPKKRALISPPPIAVKQAFKAPIRPGSNITAAPSCPSSLISSALASPHRPSQISNPLKRKRSSSDFTESSGFKCHKVQFSKQESSQTSLPPGSPAGTNDKQQKSLFVVDSVDSVDRKSTAESINFPNPAKPLVLYARAYSNRSGIHCYRNASLQALGTITRFRNLILDHACDNSKSCISCYMKAVFYKHYKAHSNRLSAHEPSQLRVISQFIGGAFARNRRLRQEDANEYIVLLLERLGTHSSKRQKNIKAAIDEIFNCTRVTKILCINQNCKKTSRTRSNADHLTITLNLPDNLRKGQRITLEDCLRYYTKVEYLADYKCEHCGHHGAKKKILFEGAPNVALIDLSRFKYNWYGGGKDRRRVDYPEILDWSPYTQQQKGRGRLSAIICHESSVLDSGHYYTIVRAGEGQWLKYDDEQVTRVKNPLIGFEQQWYMLLYALDDDAR